MTMNRRERALSRGAGRPRPPLSSLARPPFVPAFVHPLDTASDVRRPLLMLRQRRRAARDARDVTDLGQVAGAVLHAASFRDA